jgi:hypothetical protein
LIIPFDFNPYSTSVKTSSYTIPSGYYARVTASVDGYGPQSGSSVSYITIDGNTVLESNGRGAYDGVNEVMVWSQEALTRSFWVPVGTVINGSGTWYATVQLFKIKEQS